LIRPFVLRDVLLVRDLQRRSANLDLESALLGELPSLRLALMAYLFHSAAGAFTGILDSPGARENERGFVQVRRRVGSPAWDLVYLAPALDAGEEGLTIWRRLLSGLSLVAADEGVQRIFARPVHDDLVEAALAQAGFSVYAREAVYKLTESAGRTRGSGGVWRRASEADRYALARLYRNSTPHLVRQAEGEWSLEGRGPFAAQAGFPGGEGYVAGGARLRAYLGLREGSKAYWMYLLLDEEEGCDPAELLNEALGLLAGRSVLPVYCAVRGYQASLRKALRDDEHEAVAVRSLMVKHTAARVKAGERKLVPGIEKGVKAAPGMSPSGEAVHEGLRNGFQ